MGCGGSSKMGFAEFRKQQLKLQKEKQPPKEEEQVQGQQQQKQQPQEYVQQKSRGKDLVTLRSADGKLLMEVPASKVEDQRAAIEDHFNMMDAYFEDAVSRQPAFDLTPGKSYIVRGDEREPAFDSAQVTKTVGLGCCQSLITKHTTAHRAHPERPERVDETMKRLQSHAIFSFLRFFSPTPVASLAPFAAIHTKQLTDTVLPTLSKSTGYPFVLYGSEEDPREIQEQEYPSSLYGGRQVTLPADTYTNEHSELAVRASVATVLNACDRVAQGELNSAFCVVRPPGHHCTAAQPQGFCLVNNVVIAAEHLLRGGTGRLPARRVAIVDFDVHHGNGTHSIVEEDSRILFISIHRHDDGKFYPHTGHLSTASETVFSIGFDTKSGSGEDQTIGDSCFEAAGSYFIAPLLEAWAPDYLLVSAGFDAARGDPVGKMAVDHGFARLTHLMCQAVPKTIMVLEGGYNTKQVASGVISCVKSLAGIPPPALSENPAQTLWTLSTLKRATEHHLQSSLSRATRTTLQTVLDRITSEVASRAHSSAP